MKDTKTSLPPSRDVSFKLDRLYEVVLAGYETAAVVLANEWVESIRRTGNEWELFIKEFCRPHPIFNHFSQCPMTARCVQKPRGYAGDAVTLDLIYDKKITPNIGEVSVHGQRLFSALVEMPVCRSVDLRSKLIAQTIDSFAERRVASGGAPVKILSLACGHAKELEGCKSLYNGQIRTVIALDQDELSLEILKLRFFDRPVEALKLSVRDLLIHRDLDDLIGKFDFVYSAGLYDYLDQRTASRLTVKLFSCLSPGGELLLANFHAGNHGIGYMEAFMDWWLIYRTEEELKAVVEGIDNTQIAGLNQFKDLLGNIGYLQLQRTT